MVATQTFNVESIMQAMRAIGIERSHKEWTLISSGGSVWKGTPEELMIVLVRHYSLFHTPSFKDQDYDNEH